ncbi:class I adenylate-forming enzyme family protein [Ornithinimicrobium cerasi]|uniref:Acyl-CoA synthetase (AMP-forming)/AMP-acid ligase II n=1 Tax=Ornithinimicrobium cerasi TaxID=2248773 RepID=A0A285VM37_9MICO|nr:AMP-binding protein [Ornithinimicrobium cerasi]SOC53631.1 Acyl-CoA synthetase (AMP-forming)/AMP-acid ligase II [Ornithinimicrobium cerasi]
MDIGTMLTRAGARFGDRVAVEGTGPPTGPGRATDSRTFAQLADRVTRIAGGLLALGLRPGDRVLDLQSNSTAYLETDLAIRAAGLVRVALNYRLHPSDWQRIAGDCSARGLIYHERFADDIAPVREQVPHVVVVGDGPETSLETLANGAASGPLPVRDPGDLCGLHYSSGTTGHPKGAQRTHRNWFASVVNMTHDVLGGPPGPDDCYVHAGPVTHTSGLFVLPFLVAGARQIVLPTWDPQTFLEAVAERGATHTALVPTMVARLLAHGATREDLAGLRMLGYAGAPMPPEQMRRAHEQLTPHLVQYYGLVEAIPPVTVLDAADHARGLADRPELLTSAGRPALGVELAVVDEDGRPVAPGEVGEVVTRGDHVMAGYYNAERRSDLSKAVVDGWLHTGDLGRLSEDGHLWLIDRKGDMIISGGYNIYPREVEEVIAEVPEVGEVAVLGVSDPDWGQRVVALVTARAGAQVDPERVRAHCAARMASYKKPKEVRVVTEFPLNSTGKIAKKVLRAELEQHPDQEGMP